MKCPLHFKIPHIILPLKQGKMIINCFLLLQSLVGNLKQNTLAKRHPLQIVAFIYSFDDYFHFEEERGYSRHPG